MTGLVTYEPTSRADLRPDVVGSGRPVRLGNLAARRWLHLRPGLSTVLLFCRLKQTVCLGATHASPEGSHGGPTFVHRLCATTADSENSSSESHTELYSSQFMNNCLAEMWSGSEEGSYLELIDCCIAQLLSSRVMKKKTKTGTAGASRRAALAKPSARSAAAPKVNN